MVLETGAFDDDIGADAEAEEAVTSAGDDASEPK
jgi:hypothetical protein